MTRDRTALAPSASSAPTPSHRSPRRDISCPSNRSIGRVIRFMSFSLRIGWGRIDRPQPLAPLDRKQVLDQVALLLRREPQGERGVVVVDHVAQGGEPTVVEEPAFLMSPDALQ